MGKTVLRAYETGLDLNEAQRELPIRHAGEET